MKERGLETQVLASSLLKWLVTILQIITIALISWDLSETYKLSNRVTSLEASRFTVVDALALLRENVPSGEVQVRLDAIESRLERIERKLDR